MFLRKKIVFGFIALMLLTALVSVNQNAFADPLGSTQWLGDNIEKAKLVYVGFVGDDDVKKYEGKHIADSAYLPMGDLMAAMNNNGAPDKAKFEALMGKLGISRNDTHVVLYSTPAANPFISGAYWLMKYFGHKYVTILNGSLDKWEKEGRKTSADPVKISPATYVAGEGDKSMMANADYILANLKNPKVVVVDTRAEDEYTGEKDIPYIKGKGHIPGAVNLNFYPTNRGEGGVYQSVADLKAAYEAAGVTPDKEVITYCEGGPRAADTYIVLKEVLRYPDVKIYIGSWMEWGNNEKYPVEK
ncbi:MAG: sulfurtransferase [Nitrospirae bacterium]|nr:sulfurtransferase [Nitrospirota bacterium]